MSGEGAIMRILIKELRRLFDIKLIVILILFSIAYISIYLSIAQKDWSYSSSPCVVDFHRELVACFGPELSIDEWDEFMAMRQKIIDEFMDEVRKSPVMARHGINTYEKYREARNKIDELYGENMTKEDKELHDELFRIELNDEITCPLSFKLQDMNWICDDKEDGSIFTNEENADNIISGIYVSKHSDNYKRRYKLHMTSDHISLIHDSAISTIDGDFKWMIILSVIWCFVLIMPYQISERLRCVRLVKLPTFTGRKVFDKQAVASVCAGIMTGIILCGVYALLLWRKGAFDFRWCNISLHFRTYWFDMSYLQYLLLYALFVILSSVGAALLSYIVGRLSVNYIAGIGIAIPISVIYAAVINILGTAPFDMGYNIYQTWSVVRACGVGLVSVFCVIVTCAMLHRDKVRDIL